MEDVQLLRVLGEVRDRLHGGGTRADDADDLVVQELEVRPRVLVVPPGRVERVPGECLHAGDLRQLRLRQRAIGADDEPRPHRVAAVGREVPELLVAMPHRRRDRRLEHGELVQVIATGNGAAVLEDLPSLGVVTRRHVAHLVEQRQVVVRDDVARHAGIAVPVPGTAHVATSLDDADRLDADLAQPCGCEQRREAAADEQHLDLVVDRFALDDLLDVGVGGIAREVAGELRRELRGALRPVREAQVSLLGEPALDLVVVLLRALRRHVQTLSQPASATPTPGGDFSGAWRLARVDARRLLVGERVGERVEQPDNRSRRDHHDDRRPGAQPRGAARRRRAMASAVRRPRSGRRRPSRHRATRHRRERHRREDGCPARSARSVPRGEHHQDLRRSADPSARGRR